QRLPQRLLAGGALAETGLEHPAGCLTRAEAREAHLAGDALEGIVDGDLELVRVDLDGQLDLVPLEGLDGASHRRDECSWARAPRRMTTQRGGEAGRSGRGGGVSSGRTGEWRSQVAHLLWEQAVGSSNLPSPTLAGRRAWA